MQNFILSLILAISFGSCGRSQQKDILASKNEIQVGQPFSQSDLKIADGFIFTVLATEMVQSQQSLTNYQAGTIVLADKIELRVTGKLAVARTGREKFALLDELKTVNGNIVCDEMSCSFDISVFKEQCPKFSAPINVEFLVPCGDRGYLHLVSRTTIAGLPDRPFRQPIEDYEFISLGSYVNKAKQAIPYISKQHPIVFAVDSELRQNQEFMNALHIAFDYWNKMIGFEALTYDLELPLSKRFSPTASVVNFCTTCLNGTARALPYVDPISGRIISGKIDVFPHLISSDSSGWSETLAHEVGHILGLGHNFAASEDFTNHGTNTSTSVMDYGDSGPIDAALPYDLAAMQWIYLGKTSTVKYRHCSDRQVVYILGCDMSDSPVSRSVSSKIMAQSTLTAIQMNPDQIKSDIDETFLEESINGVTELFDSADELWAMEYLNVLNIYLGPMFVNAYKISAFDKTIMAQETKLEWLKLLEFTLADPRVDYSTSQRALLEFTMKVFLDTPINTETIKGFVDGYNENAIHFWNFPPIPAH